MLDFLARFAEALWVVFRESSFYLLLGFTAAGLLHALVPASLIRKLLGRRRIRSILVASLVGVPLPLCSCSVVPTAIALRRRGASRGATVSFLVSTPETGVDSIALTWGLMGWLMALFRPLAAFVTALVAGLAVEVLGHDDEDSRAAGDPAAAPALPADPCCHDSSGASASGASSSAVSAIPTVHEHGAHGHDHDHGDGRDSSAVVGLDAAAGAPEGPWLNRVIRYGFRDLLDDLSHWLLFGLIVSALVSAFVPATIVERFLGRGIVPMLMMALIGVPLYICASASTPIAASLMLKGMSPGAALVFLLTGPATNVGSIVLLTGYFGSRVVAIYVAVVALLSIAFGMLLDLVIASTGIKPVLAMGSAGGLPAPLQLGATLVFVVLLLASVARAPVPAEFARIAARIHALSGVAITRRALARAGFALAVAGWLSTSLLTVKPGERGAILRFGRLVASDLEPGSYVHAPVPIGRGSVVAVDRSRTLDVGFRTVTPDPGRVSTGEPRRVKDAREGYFLTGDENLVDINLTVEYRAKDPVRFGFQVADPEALVRAAARAAVVEVIGNQPIDEIYAEGRAQVERDTHRRVQDELDRYGAGIELTRVALLEVHAPTLVHWNFRDVASARGCIHGRADCTGLRRRDAAEGARGRGDRCRRSRVGSSRGDRPRLRGGVGVRDPGFRLRRVPRPDGAQALPGDDGGRAARGAKGGSAGRRRERRAGPLDDADQRRARGDRHPAGRVRQADAFDDPGR
ncbi:MAG: SO_0444 family Cu/Zn efflux transporter [Deltaproteobacteria bacterium]|nr:SO_0444 family Cu/Zn efflux transporter [Deltaproteobacteria bacterium]